MKTSLFCPLVCILLLAFACAPSRQWCEKAYGPCGWQNQETRVYDTTLVLPQAQVHDTLRFDCLHGQALWPPGQPTEGVRTEGQAQLSWRVRDSLIYLDCTALPETVHVPRLIERTRYVQAPKTSDTNSMSGLYIGLGMGMVLLLLFGLSYLIPRIKAWILPGHP